MSPIIHTSKDFFKKKHNSQLDIYTKYTFYKYISHMTKPFLVLHSFVENPFKMGTPPLPPKKKKKKLWHNFTSVQNSLWFIFQRGGFPPQALLSRLWEGRRAGRLLIYDTGLWCWWWRRAFAVSATSVDSCGESASCTSHTEWKWNISWVRGNQGLSVTICTCWQGNVKLAGNKSGTGSHSGRWEGRIASAGKGCVKILGAAEDVLTWYGFSPVWMRRWLLSVCRWRKRVPQISQG